MHEGVSEGGGVVAASEGTVDPAGPASVSLSSCMRGTMRRCVAINLAGVQYQNIPTLCKRDSVLSIHLRGIRSIGRSPV